MSTNRIYPPPHPLHTSSLRPLVASDVSKSYATRTVLDGVDLTVSPGQRVGLVGENGVGKSTLLRLVAGVETPDGGTITTPTDLAYLPQEPDFTGADTVAGVLRDALAPLHDAVREVERLGSAMADDPGHADAFAAALEWAQVHDAWDADRRALLAAERFGVAGIGDDRPTATLSGGQRTRLAMAALVTRRPECVLLDEPTNHLDDGAMELLESFLGQLPGVVVAASHDRVFLDAVCTHIVDLDPSHFGVDGRGGNRFGGGFSAYLDHKAQARRRWEETYAEQRDEIDRLRAETRIGTSSIAHNRGPTDPDKFVYKFQGASVDRAHARRVHNAERRLEAAERDAVRKPPAQLRFASQLTGAPRTSQAAVSVRGLVVEDRVAVRDLDVPTGGRLLVTGPNGSGKSSLIAAIDGRLTPDRGTVSVSARSVGTLVQDVSFDDSGRSAVQVYADALGAERSEVQGLGRLGLLHPRDLGLPVGTLSVGQRRRLALAILVAKAPELLLLDEPTNHISLSLATELEEALGTAPGTVIVASHDRWLRRRWADPTYAL